MANKYPSPDAQSFKEVIRILDLDSKYLSRMTRWNLLLLSLVLVYVGVLYKNKYILFLGGIIAAFVMFICIRMIYEYYYCTS